MHDESMPSDANSHHAASRRRLREHALADVCANQRKFNCLAWNYFWKSKKNKKIKKIKSKKYICDNNFFVEPSTRQSFQVNVNNQSLQVNLDTTFFSTISSTCLAFHRAPRSSFVLAIHWVLASRMSSPSPPVLLATVVCLVSAISRSLPSSATWVSPTVKPPSVSSRLSSPRV